jgi:hypothetical protein
LWGRDREGVKPPPVSGYRSSVKKSRKPVEIIPSRNSGRKIVFNESIQKRIGCNNPCPAGKKWFNSRTGKE